MDGALGKHGVVLNLRLAKGRAVVADEDELGLVEPKGLEGGLVSEDSLSTPHNHLKTRVGVLTVLRLKERREKREEREKAG